MSPEFKSVIEIVVLLITFCLGYGLGRSDKDLKRTEPHGYEVIERLWKSGKGSRR